MNHTIVNPTNFMNQFKYQSQSLGTHMMMNIAPINQSILNLMTTMCQNLDDKSLYDHVFYFNKHAQTDEENAENDLIFDDVQDDSEDPVPVNLQEFNRHSISGSSVPQLLLHDDNDGLISYSFRSQDASVMMTI